MIQNIKQWISKASETLASCMLPVIPVIVAGSVLKLLHLVLTLTGLAETSTGVLIALLGDVPFYFLPVFVAYTASRHFKTDPIYGIGASLVLLAPDFLRLMEQEAAVTFLQVPVPQNNYAYNILPSILTVYLISRLAPALEKRFPQALKGTLYPFVLFFAVVLLEITLIAPIGFIISSGLNATFAFGTKHAAFLTWGIFAASLALMIPTGVHWVFETIVFTDLATKGYDNGTMASFLILCMSLAGMDLAYSMRAKNKTDKANYFGFFLGALLPGVSEPSLFAIAMRDKKAMRSVLISSFVVGMYQGLVTIRCYFYSFPALPSMLMFYSKDDTRNFIEAIIALVASIAISFILTFVSCKETVSSTTSSV